MATHYDEGQFLLAMARPAYWTAVVQSGGYRLSKVEVGCGRNDDGTTKLRPQTDDEKLAQAMATAGRHLDIAAEFVERLSVVEEDP